MYEEDVFMKAFNLESLISKPSCFQLAYLTPIDLILIKQFKNSNVIRNQNLQSSQLPYYSLEKPVSKRKC